MADRTPPRSSDVLRRVLEQDRLDLHVSMPGRVRSYDRSTQRAEVALCLRRVLPGQEDEDPDTLEDYPILPSVPVAFFRTGSFAIHADLEAGDHVWVVFTDADLSAFWSTGADGSDPGVATRHGLNGSYCIPGAFWTETTNPDASSNPRIGKIGGPRIEWSGTEIQAGGTAALAKATQTDAQLAAIAADLVTVFAAATAGTPTTTAARSANPIASSILKGA